MVDDIRTNQRIWYGQIQRWDGKSYQSTCYYGRHMKDEREEDHEETGWTQTRKKHQNNTDRNNNINEKRIQKRNRMITLFCYSMKLFMKMTGEIINTPQYIRRTIR